MGMVLGRASARLEVRQACQLDLPRFLAFSYYEGRLSQDATALQANCALARVGAGTAHAAPEPTERCTKGRQRHSRTWSRDLDSELLFPKRWIMLVDARTKRVPQPLPAGRIYELFSAPPHRIPGLSEAMCAAYPRSLKGKLGLPKLESFGLLTHIACHSIPEAGLPLRLRG